MRPPSSLPGEFSEVLRRVQDSVATLRPIPKASKATVARLRALGPLHDVRIVVLSGSVGVCL